jgi:hypothetical protein
LNCTLNIFDLLLVPLLQINLLSPNIGLLSTSESLDQVLIKHVVKYSSHAA